MWSQQAIDAGVEAARSIVKPDGGDLILVKADGKRGCIDLRLDVTNVTCTDGACLVQGRLLEGMIMAKLQEHLEGEFELRLEDQRSVKA